MYVVAAGKSFSDIDVFGCAIAYTELLQKESKEAKAVFIGPLNHSVTKLALEQSDDYLTQYTPTTGDQFVYVDLSDPEHFAFSNENDKIFEIYDHHYGYEDYWRARLGDRSHIERVGAAATLIWEEFKKRGFEKEISSASTNLLSLAILQNTLHFTSSETNDRDLAAFKELALHVTMPNGWQQRYFDEYAAGMRARFHETLRDDTKIINGYFDDKIFVFSQLEISEDPIAFLDRYKQAIDAYWSEFQNKRCLMNIPDIASKTSLLYSDDAIWLHEVIEPLFTNITESTQTWIRVPIHQRKQILKLLQSSSI